MVSTKKLAKAKKKANRRQQLTRRLTELKKELKSAQLRASNYELLVKCPICWDRTKEVTLDCGHALCKQCWQTVLGYQLCANCPMDRKLTFSARKLYL